MPTTYSLETRVTAGVGWLDDAVVDRVGSYGRRGALVLGRGRAVGSHRREELVERFRQAGLDPVLVGGIGADGHLEGLTAAAREIPPDARWLLAVGGGSVIDAAKLLALHRDGRPLLASAGSLAELASGLGDAERRPVIAVPTCLGSGAEVSALAEVTDARGWKEPAVDPRLAPAEAWIDPAFVSPPPPPIQAAAIVDLFFNLFDPLANGAERPGPLDRVAIGLCRQVVELVARVPDLRFEDEAALELAWLSHLAVQPGLTRPTTASTLHRIEHVVSPDLGCAHGEGLAWLAGAFLRHASQRGADMARRLADLAAEVFGEDRAPDRAVERWLATLPLARPEPPVREARRKLAARTLYAYGCDGRLPGPFALGSADVETILGDAATPPDQDIAERPTVETRAVSTGRVFGGPVEGEWDWLLIVPLPFVEEALVRWQERWTRGWYPTLRVEGRERGLVVRTGPGGETARDVLTLLERAGARPRSIHLIGLCGALDLDCSLGTWVQPRAVWGDRRQRDGYGRPTAALVRSELSGSASSRSGVCGSVSGLAAETTDLLEAWKRCAVDVVDLETFAIASYGQRRNIPVSADLIVSDHPLEGAPLWASDTLPNSVRHRAIDLVSRRLEGATAGGSSHA